MIRSHACVLVGLVLFGISARTAAQENIVRASVVTPGGSVASDGEIDPQDKTQRLLLLLSGQPLLVHLEMTLHGEPFRMAREKLVDSMLKRADTDGDGTPTWDEGLENPRFSFGRLGFKGQDKAARETLLKNADTNGDGLLDRSEARQFLAQQFGGGAFSVANSPFAMQGQSSVRELLDTDKNQVLSSEEWAAAIERLKSRDSDDDDLVTQAELGGAANIYSINRGRAQPNATQLALLLGPGTKLDDLYKLLVGRYGKEGKLRSADLLRFIVLDKDQNGEIDREEISALNTMLPHIALTASFAGAKGSPKGLVLQAIAPSLGKEQQIVEETESDLALNLPGMRLRFAAASQAIPLYAYPLEQAKQLLQQFDSDKNGYLDEKEATARGGKQQFLLWDENGDGKVVAEEIKSAFELQQLPLGSQIQAVVAEGGDVLFSLLDTSGDGRLSLRERLNAVQRFKTLDKNDDNALDAQEIPSRVTVSLGQGNAVYQRLNVARPQPTTTSNNGPDWFVHMDRNGDGDLTPREFLGTTEQFKKLDVDNDGFIDPQEAAAK